MTTTAKKWQEEIRDNMVDFFREIGKANPEIEYVNDDLISRYVTDIPHPMLNRVLRTSQSFHEGAAKNIRNTLDAYRARSLPCLWLEWLMEGQPNLASELEHHGFHKIETMPGMVLELDEWNDEDIPISGFEMKSVRDSADFEMVSDILRDGFGLPENVGQAFLRYIGSVGFDEDAPIQHYLGWLDERPVSTVSTFRQGGVLGIYNVATDEDVRGRGIGFATTVHPIRLERDRGCEAAILHATKLGHSVYRRIGFQDAVQIEMYVKM